MLELPPFDALAMSLHHSPGTCALLLGSGMSSSAGIPTGWQITIDLIRRLAATKGITEHSNWEEWYSTHFGEAPRYSDILDALASTPAERRNILHSYTDPKEGDEERRPTAAHHAVARLAASGSIRVIITTNFDRLIETALREAGVEPIVIASEDAVAGATPLVHAQFTIIKLNGDYLDARIKNTESELQSYGPETNKLLDQVFDNFGLLVVGWSGEWDVALRAAIFRQPSRRYPFYWAARGAVSQLAADLITHRAGRIILINDANSFEAGRDNRCGCGLHSAPHPQSVSMAIARAKRYCRDDRFLLEFTELLNAETSTIRAFIESDDYPRGEPTNAALNSLIASLVSRSEILRRVCLVCGRWGTPEAVRAVSRMIRSLSFRANPINNGFDIWSRLRDFCASLCFYWAIAGASSGDRFDTASAIMYASAKTQEGEEPFVAWFPFLAMQSEPWKFFKGHERAAAPTSEFAYELLRKEIDGGIASGDIDDLFDQVELLISLEYLYCGLYGLRSTGILFKDFVPVGRYAWKRERGKILERLVGGGKTSKRQALLKAGLLGGEEITVTKTVEAANKLLGSIRSYYLR